jgi:hypothetical protein
MGALTRSYVKERPMRQNEPTLMAPLPPPPARADFRAIHAGHASNEARIAALIAANMALLYDHLMGAGITHVAASFICDDDTCLITGIAAFADDTRVACPDLDIPYVDLDPDTPSDALHRLPLSDAITRLACDVLQDLRAASGTTPAADGSLSLDAAARANLLDYNPHPTGAR